MGIVYLARQLKPDRKGTKDRADYGLLRKAHKWPSSKSGSDPIHSCPLVFIRG